jgi:hypothetical protein
MILLLNELGLYLFSLFKTLNLLHGLLYLIIPVYLIQSIHATSALVYLLCMHRLMDPS